MVLASDGLTPLGSGSPFRLVAGPPGEGGATLAGELDRSTREGLATALDRAALRPVAGELVFRADQLRFIDHGTLLDLDAYGRRRGMTVVLRTTLTSAARLAALLELTGLRVETLR